MFQCVHLPLLSCILYSVFSARSTNYLLRLRHWKVSTNLRMVRVRKRSRKVPYRTYFTCVCTYLQTYCKWWRDIIIVYAKMITIIKKIAMKHSVLNGSGQVSGLWIKTIQICSDFTLFAVSITTTQLVTDCIRTYLIKCQMTDLTPTLPRGIEHSSKYSSLVLFRIYICIRIATIEIALIFNLI